ncbi:TAT-variant-translocated molybdopterin oxidoreductase [Candidatus Zixiibacteriota bacterium]
MSKKDIKHKDNKKYWRSLDQINNPEAYNKYLKQEFPEGASQMNNNWSRRNFMALMGASMALAGLAGCRRPKEKIIPYVKPPEEVIPGVAQQYATTMTIGTSSYGILVESHEGRPTKIEGNPLHPSTLGASNAMIQASILGLYDPDRSQKITHKGIEKSWEDFAESWKIEFEKYSANKGEGLAVLSEAYSSPTIHRLRNKFEKQFPKAHWVTYEPISDENIIEGIELATGEKLQPVYDYSKADIILSIDCDFTLTEPENITATLGFTSGRNIETENDKMNRLYVVESAFSNTGAVADHKLTLKPNEIEQFILSLSKQLGLKASEDLNIDASQEAAKWIEILTKDLLANKSKSLVVAGKHLSPVYQALILAINKELGNIGNTIKYHKPKDRSYPSVNDLMALSDFIDSDKISSLVIIGCNPIYNAPIDITFERILKKTENSIHLSLYNDETSKLCSWHLPMSHYLEHWSDARSVDGTASVVQPLIEPLYNGKSSVEILNLLTANTDNKGYDIIKDTWKNLTDGNKEKSWRKVLHDGLLNNSSLKTKNPKLKDKNIKRAIEELTFDSNDDLSLILTASPSVYDGRFANNGWLQELPDAVTKISWDNVAQISPVTAEKLGLVNEDLVDLTFKGRSVRMPIWIVPGTADDTVILELGYGRNGVGRIADGVGFNTYELRDSETMYFGSGLSIIPTGQKYELANVQDHGSMEGRAIVREASLEEYKHEPDFAPHAVHHPPLASMWEEHKYDKGNQWGMAIDLTACTGCNACTIACQSENNIPIIGKEQVRNGREMHWIRIDRYFTGEKEEPEMVHQPVACQHCEMAPCEQVCPVAATVHDKEGLNTMVYNRCVGTRYCSNNCPYKVRRFNFFNFTSETPEVVKMAMNPDVTVRSRGVMEKCTYCIQRINRVKITAKKDNRPINDGEIIPACQQACPAKAITFGDINNPDSNVAKMKQRNRNYDLLGELNVRPRTSYLAKIRNKNPKLS